MDTHNQLSPLSDDESELWKDFFIQSELANITFFIQYSQENVADIEALTIESDNFFAAALSSTNLEQYPQSQELLKPIENILTNSALKVFTQGIQKYIDSKDNNNIVHYSFKIAELLINTNQLVSAIPFLRNCIVYHPEAQDLLAYKSHALLLLGMISNKQNQPLLANRFFRQSIGNYTKQNNPMGECFARLQLLNSYLHLEQYALATECADNVIVKLDALTLQENTYIKVREWLQYIIIKLYKKNRK